MRCFARNNIEQEQGADMMVKLDMCCVDVQCRGNVAVGDVLSMLSSHDPQGSNVQTKTNRQVEVKAL
jgi:hypothetical protein